MNEEKFNQSCNIITISFLLLFTDFVPDAKDRYTLGFFIIAMIFLNVGVNVIKLILNTGKAILKELKTKYYKWQAQNKAKKVLMEERNLRKYLKKSNKAKQEMEAMCNSPIRIKGELA